MILFYINSQIGATVDHLVRLLSTNAWVGGLTWPHVEVFLDKTLIPWRLKYSCLLIVHIVLILVNVGSLKVFRVTLLMCVALVAFQVIVIKVFLGSL